MIDNKQEWLCVEIHSSRRSADDVGAALGHGRGAAGGVSRPAAPAPRRPAPPLGRRAHAPLRPADAHRHVSTL